MIKSANFLHYLNTHDLDDSYSRIILNILKGRKKVKDLSINELAKQCFVSNATISRFVKHFNYENFSDLKREFSLIGTVSPEFIFRTNNVMFSNILNEPQNFISNYKKRIIDSLDDVEQCLDMKQIDHFLSHVYENDPVYLFGSESSYGILKEIQGGLFISGKVILSGEKNEDFFRIAKRLNQQSTVIIASSFGNFLAENQNLVNLIIDSKATTFFLTQHTENMLTSSFDHTIFVTSKNHVEAGSYPLTFFCEFLVRYYYSLFNDIASGHYKCSI